MNGKTPLCRRPALEVPPLSILDDSSRCNDRPCREAEALVSRNWGTSSPYRSAFVLLAKLTAKH
jgi:hypothetical protein